VPRNRRPDYTVVVEELLADGGNGFVEFVPTTGWRRRRRSHGRWCGGRWCVHGRAFAVVVRTCDGQAVVEGAPLAR